MGEKSRELPTGVTIRTDGNQERIRINFTFRGTRCRETLKIDPSKKNIRYAANLLGEIRNKIERQTFNYLDYFPNSKTAKQFGPKVDIDKTVLEYLEEYQDACVDRKLSPATLNGYRKIKTSIEHFHKYRVVDVTPLAIKEFIKLNRANAPKTLRNKLSYLRLALDEAVIDGLIEINPVNNVKLGNYAVKSSAKQEEDKIDPFTPNEVDAILNKCKPHQYNLIAFLFNTGVRSSEWIELKWSDISFVDQTVKISRANVLNTTKATKTAAGKRIIPLNEIALNALQQQKAYTFMFDSYVFMQMHPHLDCVKTGKLQYNPDTFRKHHWSRILKAAGVRYRYPYQTRHTFATKHVSQGCNIWQLANWMGHASPELVFNHYGSFIEEYQQNGPVTAQNIITMNKNY